MNIEMMAFKKNYSILKITQLLIEINNKLENLQEYELSDLLSPFISKIDETIYFDIEQNLKIEYSGDRYEYIILYSILQKTFVNDLHTKIINLMSCIQNKSF